MTDNIKNRQDLIIFIKQLAKEARHPDDNWSNRDLVSYLEAMAAWIEDMDGYYKNTGKPTPKELKWATIADILKAATMYE